MAAIIAQMAAANRERKKRKSLRNELPPSKCAYQLPSFDPCYDPRKHNRYVRKKADKDCRQQVLDAIEAEKIAEEERQKEELQEKRWLSRLEHCRTLLDPEDESKDVEEQLTEILRALEVREARAAAVVDALKAAAGIVFIAIFAFILTYFYVTFL